MKSRNIVFTEPCVAQLLCEDMKELEAGKVRVKILRTTISPGTERATLIGDPNVAGHNAPEVKFPRRLGYSASGIVYAIGKGVESVKVGDRVITAKYSGTEVKIDGTEYSIVRQSDILAIVE